MAADNPLAAEQAAAAVAATAAGQILLAELARITIHATGALATASPEILRAHAGKCALYLHITNLIKRGNGHD